MSEQSMTKTVAIIQARFGSTRLPGKVLKPLGNIQGGQGIVLDHAIQRCRAIPSVDVVVIATTMPRLSPHRLDCEVFTRDGLERANRTATAPYDREHVTPWLRRTAAITRTSLIGPGWPAIQQRWTLDFPEDYAFFAALFPL